MRLLFVASEIFPLAKTGGLADISHALPAALRAGGVDVHLLMPGYPQALERLEQRKPGRRLDSVLGFDDVTLVSGHLPGTDIPIQLVDCPSLYRREGGLYQDEEGSDWPDNHLRFAMLSHIAALLATGRLGLEWQPDVVHANDWHAGLVPLLAKSLDPAAPPTLFTIHNMAFQGLFAADEAGRLGIEPAHMHADGAEFYGNLSFLKAGIRYADQIATVSPTYAREILTPEFGGGLEGLLAARADDITGILNGVDYGVWDPAADPLIPARFSSQDMSGKRVAKAALQAGFGLAVDPDVPLFAFMSRLTEQKMADRVIALAPALAQHFGQLLVVAQGERKFETAFIDLARGHPGRIAVRIGYSEPEAHRLLAGADMLLAPARFEPCGLTQLYAMRYGALPIVCATGGLVDTVVDASPEALAARTATGFHAAGGESDGLLEAVERAVALYRQPLLWRRMRDSAMKRDFSWAKPARRYHELYRRMTATAEAPPAGEDAAPQQLRA